MCLHEGVEHGLSWRLRPHRHFLPTPVYAAEKWSARTYRISFPAISMEVQGR